jgi:predicted enzyme related to lactoylglutathione lyase
MRFDADDRLGRGSETWQVEPGSTPDVDDVRTVPGSHGTEITPNHVVDVLCPVLTFVDVRVIPDVGAWHYLRAAAKDSHDYSLNGRRDVYDDLPFSRRCPMFLPTADTASGAPPGTPCWVDLATLDTSMACEFYGSLFNWEFHSKNDPVGGDGRYIIALRDNVQVAGLYHPSAGNPTGWSLHLRVAGAVNTVQWVEHLGGSVRLGPLEIPERGVLLHVTDPSGAPVVLWQPPSGWIFGAHLPGMFCGADLNTYDGSAADEFYSKLFGYTSEQIGGDGIDYAEWRIGYERVLYRCVMDEHSEPASPHWLVYFEVDPDVGTDALAETAHKLGGGVLVEPYDTTFGRTALLTDPGGAPFAVIDHSRPVDLGVGRAEVDDPHDD